MSTRRPPAFGRHLDPARIRRELERAAGREISIAPRVASLSGEVVTASPGDFLTVDAGAVVTLAAALPGAMGGVVVIHASPLGSVMVRASGNDVLLGKGASVIPAGDAKLYAVAASGVWCSIGGTSSREAKKPWLRSSGTTDVIATPPGGAGEWRVFVDGEELSGESSTTLDTVTLSSSAGWRYIYAESVAGSLNIASSVTAPTAETKESYLGSAYWTGSAITAFVQVGRDRIRHAGANLYNLGTSVGGAGTTEATWTSVSLAAIVPPSAVWIDIIGRIAPDVNYEVWTNDVAADSAGAFICRAAQCVGMIAQAASYGSGFGDGIPILTAQTAYRKITRATGAGTYDLATAATSQYIDGMLS